MGLRIFFSPVKRATSQPTGDVSNVGMDGNNTYDVKNIGIVIAALNHDLLSQ
jgi:hypothetical protein